MPDQSDDQSKLLPKEVVHRYISFGKIAFMVINIALCSFYFGYGIVYFSTLNITTMLEIFAGKPQSLEQNVAEGLLNACIPFGALIGALSSSIFIKNLSRRKCLLVVNAFAFVVGGLVFIQNFYMLTAMRVCQGFCVGFYSAIGPLIVNQLSPSQISGTLGTFSQLGVAGGVFFGCVFKLILSTATGDQDGNDIWPIVFGFPLITVATQSAILLFVFPYQTPKYLLQHNKEEQAKRLIQLIYKPEYVDSVLQQKKDDLAATNARKNAIDEQQNDKGLGPSILSEGQSYQKPKTRNPITTVIAIHLAILQQFSGINSVVAYGGKVAGEVLPAVKPYLPSILNLQQVLATLATGYLLTKFGRKIILQAGSMGEGCSCVIIAIGFYIRKSEEGADNSFANFLILAGLFIFMAVFGLSLGPVVWLYIPEIVQPNIVPFSTMANWISAFLIMLLFPPLVDAIGYGTVFLFYGGWCIGSFLFNQKFVVQTKGKSQTQIIAEYAKLKLC